MVLVWTVVIVDVSRTCTSVLINFDEGARVLKNSKQRILERNCYTARMTLAGNTVRWVKSQITHHPIHIRHRRQERQLEAATLHLLALQ